MSSRRKAGTTTESLARTRTDDDEKISVILNSSVIAVDTVASHNSGDLRCQLRHSLMDDDRKQSWRDGTELAQTLPSIAELETLDA
jgi:hypothetical protein